MKFSETTIKGVFVIEVEPHYDSRGMFSRIYCKKEFSILDIDKYFVQANHSFTFKKGTIRGMHYQKPPHAESKLIRCLSGKVFDVIIDLRENSETYLNWTSVELSKENMQMIFIPEGCAHGFQTLEDNCELIYFHSEYYAPDKEGTIYYADEKININWPLQVTEISDKDKNASRVMDYKGAFNK